MKEDIKVLINNFLIITVGILLFTSVYNLIIGCMEYSVVFPFQILFTGFLCSLPTLLFKFKTEPTKKQFFVRVFVHFVVIAAIVLLEGWWLEWYKSFAEGLIVFFIFLLVYLLAWGYTAFMNISEAKKINEALREFNEEEDV